METPGPEKTAVPFIEFGGSEICIPEVNIPEKSIVPVALSVTITVLPVAKSVPFKVIT